MQLAAAVILAGVALGLVLGAVAYLQRRLLIVKQLMFPLTVAALAAALKVFTLVQPGRFPALDQALSWVLLFLPVVLVLRLGATYFFEVHLRSRRDVQFPALIPSVVMAVVYLVVASATVKLTYPEISLAPLLATSAVTSLVLGLALQPILNNFFAGIIISLEKPFRLNDWIRIGETEGRVVSITWRTTHLRTRSNDDLIVPNARIADEHIVNFEYPNPLHLEKIPVGVDYRMPPYRVRQALIECAGVAGVLEHPSADVYLRSFDDSSIGYELRIWTSDRSDDDRIGSEVRFRIWEKFKALGINIPFPIRTVELAPRPRAQVDGRRPRGRLFVIEGKERGRTVELGEAEVIVGRSRTCTLALEDSQASKEHFRVEWAEDGYVLTDLQSSGGTLVNGAPTTRRRLVSFDRIAVGSTSMVFEHDGA